MATIPSLLAQVGMSFDMPDFLAWIGIAWLALSQVLVLILIIQVIIRILKTRYAMRREKSADQPPQQINTP